MPIAGLTDRGMSFPEIGIIRKGSPKTENRPGKDLDYFRMEFVDNDAEEVFRSKYGEQPKELNVVLPFNRIEQLWDAWLEGYTAGRMVARSDGEHFEYWIDTANGEAKVLNGKDVNTGEKVPYTDGMSVGKDYQNKDIYCSPVGRLKVVIPELGRYGFFTLNTTSVHDIINLSSQLEGIFQVNGGQIAGIPLILRRRPKEISTPDARSKGKRIRRTKWLLSIEADPEWARAKIMQIKHSLLPGNGYHEEPNKLLPEPNIPEEIEEDEIEGEYEEIIDEELVEETPQPLQQPELVKDEKPKRSIPANTDEMDGIKPAFKVPKIPGSPKDFNPLYEGWATVFSKEDIALVVAASNNNAQIAHTKLLAEYKRLEKT